MTICIAAIADNSSIGQAKIVFCTDSKGSSPLGSRELLNKNLVLSLKWRCLTAGGDDDLNALVPLLRMRLRELAKLAPVDETNVVPTFRQALQDRKLERCNEFTLGRYGLTYDEFRRNGKNQFPEDQFRADMAAIAQIELNIECIAAGFLDSGFPMLLKLDGKGGVTVKEDFAVAGEGGYLAESGLIHRDHYDVRPLSRTLYCVYEAKKYAERVSSVNKITHLSVLHPDGKSDLMNAAGKNYLETQYAKYSPQEISAPIEASADFFKRFDPGTFMA